MSGFLTTHILDTALGTPAAGLKIDLFRFQDGVLQHLSSMTSNEDGRTNSPILPQEQFQIGHYELLFHAGDYLRAHHQNLQEPLFLDQIPIRFGMNENSHYHVPLLLSPFGYSTYRGS
ncbi:MAG: hydroxyisourate hydrolase [Cohaesibacter sp.]|nr:hydroxyisourate hydrolase [Cohaesibacter sp.]